MSVLDELRETIDAHVEAASGDRKHTWMDAVRLLDAFEAEHPTLHEAGDCADAPVAVTT